MTAEKIHLALTALGDPDIAAHSMRFFKTGPGEYGEGDRFLGIRVPVLRKKAKESMDGQFHNFRVWMAEFCLDNRYISKKRKRRKRTIR